MIEQKCQLQGLEQQSKQQSYEEPKSEPELAPKDIQTGDIPVNVFSGESKATQTDTNISDKQAPDGIVSFSDNTNDRDAKDSPGEALTQWTEVLRLVGGGPSDLK